MRANDLTGKKFGRLEVISRAADRVTKSGYKTVMWNCKCDCGKEVVVRGKCLTAGVTKSCGCLAKELVSARASKHGGYGTRLYAIWDSMRQRCNNPSCHAYKNYGGRGVHICDQWDDFSSFREWALVSGYDKDSARGSCTLDRIDVNKGYCPENCRWVSMKKQSNNKRDTISITYHNETRTLVEWSEILGVKYNTLWARYKRGLPTERVLSNHHLTSEL